MKLAKYDLPDLEPRTGESHPDIREPIIICWTCWFQFHFNKRRKLNIPLCSLRHILYIFAYIAASTLIVGPYLFPSFFIFCFLFFKCYLILIIIFFLTLFLSKLFCPKADSLPLSLPNQPTGLPAWRQSPKVVRYFL